MVDLPINECLSVKSWSLVQGRHYGTVWHMQEKRCINMLLKKIRLAPYTKGGKKGNMKKIILGNLISYVIWMVTVTVSVIGVALFIDDKK
jgi:hypothetical protein